MGLIERPPLLFRKLVPGGIFRMPSEAGKKKCVYITFDDGPIPEITPLVLDLLDKFGVKGTFFMVGENAMRNPDLVEEVVRRGHSIGNHTYHHLAGSSIGCGEYIKDVADAAKYINSSLFRPPHGWLRPSQAKRLIDKYKIIMYDLVSRDYSARLTAKDVINNVKRYARDGSIIVFHDSLKAWPRLEKALPAALEWLQNEGYEFKVIN